jgi:hypothetical protein
MNAVQVSKLCRTKHLKFRSNEIITQYNSGTMHIGGRKFPIRCCTSVTPEHAPDQISDIALNLEITTR